MPSSPPGLSFRRLAPPGLGSLRFVKWGRVLTGVALVLSVAGALGILSADYGSLAIFVAVIILALGLASTDLVLLPVLAFPATLVMIRTGPLSVSDLVLIVATVPALMLYRRTEAKGLQPLLWAGAVYLACLVPTLVLNRYLGNYIEWAHELILVLGSLLVGWVTGRAGRAGAALLAFQLGCVGIGVAATLQALYLLRTTGVFGPAYLEFLHKNFIGNTLAFSFLIALVRPRWLNWPTWFHLFVMVVSVLGIAASNSRQAVVSVFAGVAFLALRSWGRGATRRGRVLLLLLIPAVIATAGTVSEQLESGDAFNSTSQRLTWYAESLRIWQQSPLFGVGLRWWNTGDHPAFQPPNAFFEMISSAGVLGLFGFLVLCIAGLWVVLLLPRQYADLAAVVMIARFVQGQLDLYWVAGQSALPWMMTGLMIGLQALHQAQDPTTRGFASELPPLTTARRAR